jgi:hypothetical protein
MLDSRCCKVFFYFLIRFSHWYKFVVGSFELWGALFENVQPNSITTLGAIESLKKLSPNLIRCFASKPLGGPKQSEQLFIQDLSARDQLWTKTDAINSW